MHMPVQRISAKMYEYIFKQTQKAVSYQISNYKSNKAKLYIIIVYKARKVQLTKANKIYMLGD